jgi:tetratricopeptide (TPR) repeat protein
MRCPRCGTQGAAGGYCSGCGRGLFAWLGDPLGAMETVGPAAAAAAPVSLRSRRATSTGKLIFGLCVIALVFVASPVWSAVLLASCLVALWRWPGVRWLPWSLFFGGGLLLAVLSQPAVSTTLLGTRSRPSATVVATFPPAAAAATAVARQAEDVYDRGAERWHAGDSVAAIEAFTKTIDLRPDWGDAFNMRALARVSAGQIDAALDDARRAVYLDRSASRVDTIDTRAYVLLKRGAYEAALADYDAVMASPRELPAASLLGRGIVLSNLGQPERARKDLEEGLRLATDLKLDRDPQLADLESEAIRIIETLPEANSLG